MYRFPEVLLIKILNKINEGKERGGILGRLVLGQGRGTVSGVSHHKHPGVLKLRGCVVPSS